MGGTQCILNVFSYIAKHFPCGINILLLMNVSKLLNLTVRMLTCMVLLYSDSSSAAASSAAFISVDESKYVIILAAAGAREEAL